MPLLTRLTLCTTLLLPALLSAQTPDSCATAPQMCATLINTHAGAESRLPSTAADISVQITANGKDLLTVQRQLAEKSTSLLGYLRGEKAQRLITNAVNFTPETKSFRASPDKTVGYDGSLSISFRVTAEKAPAVLSGVLDHGANTILSTYFTPTEEEIAATRRDLAAEATRTAIAQADGIAKAAGMHVVSVRTISVEPDQDDNASRFRASAGLMMDMKVAAPSMPIATAPGEQVFSSRVDITVAANH